MNTITPGRRFLVDVLAQFACQVAMAITDEPHERVPEDLKDLMRALELLDASDPLYMSSWTVDSCASALIFVARHEPDLFPKPFARAIVHKLEASQLWNVVRDFDGLEVEGIVTTYLTNYHYGRIHLWNRLNACAPNATELLIAAQPFGRILDAYEEEVHRPEKLLVNMQL
jgi:hypothetical protein